MTSDQNSKEMDDYAQYVTDIMDTSGAATIQFISYGRNLYLAPVITASIISY